MDFNAPVNPPALVTRWDPHTVGHRRQVTAVTRLLRWRRRKTRLQVRPLLTMLQDMDRCDFWHANRYWIALTCDTVIFGHYAAERSGGALRFSDGRRVTWSKEAGDWGFRAGQVTHTSDAVFASWCWDVILTIVLWKMLNPGSPNGPPTVDGWVVDGWVVHLSSGWFANLLGPWNQLKTTNIFISECCPLMLFSNNKNLW